MLLRTLVLTCSFAFTGALFAPPAAACEAHAARFKTITVDELTTLTSTKGKVTVFDANGGETRAKFGVIPGAKLLSHYADYDVAKELPANKADAIVFYCASDKCSSAPTAAKKAAEAGYTNIYVMKAGIRGWKEAAKPTTAAVPRA